MLPTNYLFFPKQPKSGNSWLYEGAVPASLFSWTANVPLMLSASSVAEIAAAAVCPVNVFCSFRAKRAADFKL